MRKEKASERYALIYGKDGSLTLLSDPLGYHLSRISSLRDLQRELARASPEVVVLELALRIDDGLKLLRVVRDACPTASVVAKFGPNLDGKGFFSVELRGARLVLRPLDTPPPHGALRYRSRGDAAAQRFH